MVTGKSIVSVVWVQDVRLGHRKGVGDYQPGPDKRSGVYELGISFVDWGQERFGRKVGRISRTCSLILCGCWVLMREVE